MVGPWYADAAVPADLEIVQGQSRTDADIAHDLREALAVGGLAVAVTCADGVVTLAGVVEDRAQQRLAERIAGFVLGVRDVRDRTVAGD